MIDLLKNDRAQGLLDFLAYSENIPLRILDLDALNNLTNRELYGLIDSSRPDEECEAIAEKALDELLKVVSLYFESTKDSDDYTHLSNPSRPPDINFSDLPPIIKNFSVTQGEPSSQSESVSIVDRLEKKLWLGHTSNPLSIDHLFRLSLEWRWFCLLWIFKNRYLFTEINHSTAFDIPGLNFYCEPLDTVNGNYVLFIGPIYETTKERSIKDFHQTFGLRILECYSFFHHHYTFSSVSNRFTSEEMSRVLHTRTPFSASSVKKRVNTVIQVLEVICKFIENGLLQNENALLQRKEYLLQRVSRAIIIILRLSQSKNFEELVCKNFPKSVNRNVAAIETIEIEYPIYDENEFFNLRVILNNCNSDNPDWSFQTTKMNRQEPAGLFTSARVNGNSIPRSQDNPIYNDLNHRIERWGERVNSRRNGVQTLSCGLLGDWLNHQHLISESRSINNSGQTTGLSASTEYYNFVSRVINEGLRTDLCSIYKYEPHMLEGGLKVKGYHSNSNSWSSENINLIGKHMEDLANKHENNLEKLSKLSLVFNSIKTNRLLYVIGNQSNAEISNANLDKNKITWPNDVEHPGDIMVAPIIVQGRVWGAVEVACQRQFVRQPNMRFSLNHYAALLGSFFFNRTFTDSLASIGELSRKAEPLGSNKETFNNLCELISRIFMSRATVILVSDASNPMEYEVKGTAGPTYFSSADQTKSYDLSKFATRNLFIGKLYEEYKSPKQTKMLLAHLSPNEQDAFIEDDTPYYVLGKDYCKGEVKGSIVNELLADGIEQVMAFAFDLPDRNYDVEARDNPQDRDNKKPKSEKLLEELDSFDNVQVGRPLGIVLVYNQKYHNLPHWYAVTEILSDNIISCVDKILVEHMRENARGKVIRHEINKTIDSIEQMDIVLSSSFKNISRFSRESDRQLNSVLGLMNKQRRDITTRRSWTDLSEAEKNNLFEWIQNMPFELNRLTETSKSVLTKMKNLQNVYDQLRTQIEAVEKPEIFDIERFLGLKYRDEEDVVHELALYETLFELRSQYQSVLLDDRGINMSISTINRDLFLRMSPKIFSHLIRNVLNNWGKYARDNSNVEVELNRRARKGVRSYELVFKNIGLSPTNDEDVSKYFEFGRRGLAARTDSSGDGLGLYWMKRILKYWFDIDVTFQSEHIGDGIYSNYVLTWHLDRYWIFTK